MLAAISVRFGQLVIIVALVAVGTRYLKHRIDDVWFMSNDLPPPLTERTSNRAELLRRARAVVAPPAMATIAIGELWLRGILR